MKTDLEELTTWEKPADYLGMKQRKTFLAWVRKTNCPRYELNHRNIRYKMSDVLKALKSQKRTAGAL